MESGIRPSAVSPINHHGEIYVFQVVLDHLIDVFRRLINETWFTYILYHLIIQIIKKKYISLYKIVVKTNLRYVINDNNTFNLLKVIGLWMINYQLMLCFKTKYSTLDITKYFCRPELHHLYVVILLRSSRIIDCMWLPLEMFRSCARGRHW